MWRHKRKQKYTERKLPYGRNFSTDKSIYDLRYVKDEN